MLNMYIWWFWWKEWDLRSMEFIIIWVRKFIMVVIKRNKEFLVNIIFFIDVEDSESDIVVILFLLFFMLYVV